MGLHTYKQVVRMNKREKGNQKMIKGGCCSHDCTAASKLPLWYDIHVVSVGIMAQPQVCGCELAPFVLVQIQLIHHHACSVFYIWAFLSLAKLRLNCVNCAGPKPQLIIMELRVQHASC
jgi:hypothetical protein